MNNSSIRWYCFYSKTLERACSKEICKEQNKSIFFQVKKVWGLCVSKHKVQAFIKLKRKLIQEHSQHQSANLSFIFFSGRKICHFHCGRGIRSWIVLRSNKAAAKPLTKALLVGDGTRQPRVNVVCVCHCLTLQSAAVFQSDWNMKQLLRGGSHSLIQEQSQSSGSETNWWWWE